MCFCAFEITKAENRPIHTWVHYHDVWDGAWFVLDGWHVWNFPQVPPTCIIDFGSKKPMIFLRCGVSCFGFGVVGGVFLFFFKPTTVPDYLHTVQYVCLLEWPSSWRIIPDVLCSKIPTLMLQLPLSLFVYVVISCHAVFLYQRLLLFWNEV